MSASKRRWALRTAQLLLTLIATYFLFRSLRFSWAEIADLGTVRWRPRPMLVVASFALLLAVFMYLVMLWSRMVRALGGPALGLGDSVRVFFVANLGRYVPGKVWQMAGLTYLAGRRGVSVPVASSAAVLGQLFSLGAAAIVAAVTLAAGATARFPRELAPWALALGAVVALVTTVPWALRLLLRGAFRLTRRGREVPQLDSWFGARWLGLYLPAWLAYGVAFGLLWSSFPALSAISWPAAVGGFAGAYFLGYAAVFAPAGVGVREGAMAVLLAPWLGAAEAAVLAVIARIWMTVAEILPLLLIAASGASGWLRGNSSTEDHAI
jgi:uncharacterized membrane protein YbhN (UPF0104 family)